MSLAKSILNQLLKQLDQSTNPAGKAFIKLVREVIAQYEDTNETIQSKFDQMEQRYEGLQKQMEEELSKAKLSYEEKIAEIMNKLSEVQSENEKLKKSNESYKNLPTMKDFDDLIDINCNLRSNVESLEKDLKYSKLKENKLMYLFFCAQESGFPIGDFYDKIKKIPTEKFEDLLDSSNSK